MSSFLELEAQVLVPIEITTTTALHAYGVDGFYSADLHVLVMIMPASQSCVDVALISIWLLYILMAPFEFLSEPFPYSQPRIYLTEQQLRERQERAEEMMKRIERL